MKAEETAAPAMWRHVNKVYDAMQEAADEKGVWTGFLSHLMFTDLGIPVPYYGRITSLLVQMGSAEQLQRGGNTSPSRWRLIKSPDRENFDRIAPHKPKERSSQKLDGLEGRVADITEQFSGIDVKKALFDLQNQINELKGKAHEHEDVA